MIPSTTATIRGREVERYLGVVFGGAVLGVNVVGDLLGSVRDFTGGRSGAYGRELGTAPDTAMRELPAQARSLGADAAIGIDPDHEKPGANGGMLMVSASGTAVALKAEGSASGPWTRPAG